MTKGTYLKACDTCDKTIVIKLPSYVQQRHPVLKIGESIVLHTTDVPEWNVSDSQSERQVSWSVEKNMPKL